MAPKIFALLSLSVAAFGQTPPKDVDGWGKIKWGAKSSEVRALYEVTGEEQTGAWDYLKIKPVQICEVSMYTALGAKRGSDSVSLVHLFCGFGNPKEPRLGSPHDFDEIKTLLSQKYGSAKSEEAKIEQGRRFKVALWVFPSTSIRLKLWQFVDSEDLGMIELDYEAIDKKALDSI